MVDRPLHQLTSFYLQQFIKALSMMASNDRTPVVRLPAHYGGTTLARQACHQFSRKGTISADSSEVHVSLLERLTFRLFHGVYITFLIRTNNQALQHAGSIYCLTLSHCDIVLFVP